MNQIFKFKSDKLCPWPNSHSLPKPGNSHPGDDPRDLEAKGSLLSPRSVLPPVSLSSNRELLAERRKEGGRVSESRVVTELTWHWKRKGHCPGVQGAGLGGPVSHASLSHPLLGCSKHLSIREARDGVESSGKRHLLWVFLGRTTSNKGSPHYPFPRAKAKVLFFLSHRLTRSQPSALWSAWSSLLRTSFFHNSLKNRLNSQQSFFGD